VSARLKLPNSVTDSELDSCRAAGERGPERKLDEGPGETCQVSPGAARERQCRSGGKPRTHPGLIERA
jgi:hypothetical protein